MNLESIAQAVVEFVRANREFAPLILGLLAFGESLAFVSLVIPAATILIAVGFVVAAAEISFWQAWLGAVCGGVLGAWISFTIGGHYKKAAYGIWPLSRNPALIAKGERFFFRFGPWAVFFGRILRAYASGPAADRRHLSNAKLVVSIRQHGIRVRVGIHRARTRRRLGQIPVLRGARR